MKVRNTLHRCNCMIILVLAILILVCATYVAIADDGADSNCNRQEVSLQTQLNAIDTEQNTNADPQQGQGSTVSDSTAVERTIEDGDYTIASHEDNNYVVDIYGNGTANGTNVEMYHANGGTNQRMHIKYVSEDGGYYLINGASSGKSLDVCNTNNSATRDGANVQIYQLNGGQNQRWAIIKLAEGGYKIKSLISGKILSIFGDHPKDQANVEIREDRDSKSQIFDLIRLADAPSNKTVEDGDYIIANPDNNFKVVDVYGGLSNPADGTNVEIYDANGSGAQKFHIAFTYDSLTGGSYRITHAVSGKSLDVYGGSKASGANVEIWSSNDSDAQKWLIKEAKKGIYNIIMMASGNVLDIAYGRLDNCTNIAVYSPNGGTNQQFVLKPYADVETELKDGVYTIVSATDDSQAMGLEDSSNANETNIRMQKTDDSLNQRFIIQKYGNNSYRIMSCATGKVMDVIKGGSSNGTGITTWQNNNGSNQRFDIRKTGDGAYYLVAAVGKVLGIASASDSLEINEGKGSENQRFNLIPVTDYAPVKDGAYILEVIGNNEYAVDVYGNGTMQNINIQLYQKNGGNNQIFKVYQGSDGLYYVQNVYSRHVLDVAGGSLDDGANVIQYAINGGLNQKWLAIVNADGSITFVNSGTGKALDIYSAKYSNGTNIEQWTSNGSDAQKFKLVPTTYDTSLDNRPIDYRIYTPDTFWTRIGATAKSLGNSLWNAYNWVAGFSRYYLTSNGRTSWPIMSSRDYAIYGLNHRGGDCIVMASTLRYIAEYLGYNAIQRFGYVGSATHSWVEINGKVYDANFKNETGRNGFGISYGQKGTWKYRIVTNI